MIDKGIIDLNAHVATPSFHLVVFEVGAVISDDAVGDAITVYNPGYEVYHWSGFGRFNWFGLYPFGEFIYHEQQVFFLMASSFMGSDHIKLPDRKGPSNGDCLESSRPYGFGLQKAGNRRNVE